jgi:hypothetical protein
VLPAVRRLAASDDDRVREGVAVFLAACNEAVEHEKVDDLDNGGITMSNTLDTGARALETYYLGEQLYTEDPTQWGDTATRAAGMVDALLDFAAEWDAQAAAQSAELAQFAAEWDAQAAQAPAVLGG